MERLSEIGRLSIALGILRTQSVSAIVISEQATGTKGIIDYFIWPVSYHRQQTLFKCSIQLAPQTAGASLRQQDKVPALRLSS